MSRLEEIKEHYQLWRFNEKNRALPSSTGIDYEDLIYLVNRVEELEKDNKRLRNLNYHNNLPAMRSMHDEIERYKQALEEIANAGENIDDLYYHQINPLRS